MSQAINLKEAGSRLQKLIQSLRSSNEECEVKDERGETVAVILPADQYVIFQKEWDEDFKVFHEVAKDLKGYSAEELQTRVDQAVEDVKRQPRTAHQTP
jgi:hypothetical protein